MRFFIFLTSLLTGCLIINVFNYQNDYFPLEEKVEYFRRHKDDYNVLFIGNSMVLRHLIPKDFDQYVSGEGVPVKSYNLGFSGANFYEIKDTLQRIKKMKPAHLKWVFLEMSFNKGLYYKNGEVRNWHLYRIKNILKSFVYFQSSARSESLGQKVIMMIYHFKMFLLKYSNHGLLSLYIRKEMEFPGDFNYLSEAQGFIAADQRKIHIGEKDRELEFHGEESVYLKDSENKIYESKLSYADWVIIHELVESVHEIGAVPIVFESPTAFKQSRYLKADDADGHVFWLESYQNFEKYPEFFDVTHRYDQSHLRESGARIFTRVVARDFLKLTKETGQTV